MALELTSDAIHPNQALPTRFSCEGERVSPPLAWKGAPRETAAFVLIVDDPDAPRGTFTHWVLYNLPGDATYLEENIPQVPRLGNGALQGQNDFGGSGYGAPCPPDGDAPHHYRFTLYALDTKLPLGAGATKKQVLDAMRTHVLDQTQIVGTYQRKGRV